MFSPEKLGFGEKDETRHDQSRQALQDAEHEIAKFTHPARVIALVNDDFIDLVRDFLERTHLTCNYFISFHGMRFYR